MFNYKNESMFINMYSNKAARLYSFFNAKEYYRKRWRKYFLSVIAGSYGSSWYIQCMFYAFCGHLDQTELMCVTVKKHINIVVFLISFLRVLNYLIGFQGLYLHNLIHLPKSQEMIQGLQRNTCWCNIFTLIRKYIISKTITITL